jgi:hypothetical protein
MASCLGIYIDNNIIKYSKVSKNKDKLSIEAFGVKFYENLRETIKQIIEETYSYKIPISVNLSGEMYNFFDMFALLGKNNLSKAINTEFESFCAEKDFNPNVFERRYILTENADDGDKVKAIYVSANKLELSKRVQQLEGYRVENVSPMSITISNIANVKQDENALIVNMEDSTTITTIIKGKVYHTETIEKGAGNVLRAINLKENSYSKAYEICKNTTIYTAGGEELSDFGEEQTYLQDIMPTLYEIVSHVMKIVNGSTQKIKNIYLTGTLASVNNIDLYFQEYIPETRCRILKPYFLGEESKEVSIKDYIEANSATALAMQGIGEGIEEMNFHKSSFSSKFAEFLQLDIGGGSKKDVTKGTFNAFFVNDFNEKLSLAEKQAIRVAISILLLIIIYALFSAFLTNRIHNKEDEVDALISDTQAQIELANADKDKIDKKTNEYKSMTKSLQNLNDRISDINGSKNIIPNLLNQIMFIIPENVQVLSIENTTDKHIVMSVKAAKYEQIGYFKAKLKSEGVLSNVNSDSGTASGNVVTVKIEGDM